MLTKDTDALNASHFGISSKCHGPPVVSQTAGEEENLQGVNDAPWKKNYEKIWVEIEKRETKSQYRNVAAELKEMFGELTPNQPDNPDPEGGAAEEKEQQEKEEEAPFRSRSEVLIEEEGKECEKVENDSGPTLEEEGSEEEGETVKEHVKCVAKAAAEHEPKADEEDVEVPSSAAAEEPSELECESNGAEVVVRTAEEEPSGEEEEMTKGALASAINAEESEVEEEEGKGEVEVRVSSPAEDSSEEEDDDVVIIRPVARARSIMLHSIPEQRESSGQEDSQSEEFPHPLRPPKNPSNLHTKEVCEEEDSITAPVQHLEINVLSLDHPRSCTIEADLEADHTNQSDGERPVKPSSQPHRDDDLILAIGESRDNPSSTRTSPSPSTSFTQSPVEYRSRQTSETERKNSGPCQEDPEVPLSPSSRCPSTPSGLSDEELQVDLQRFKYKVGRLRVVFQDMQKERARLRKKVKVMPVSMVIFFSSPTLIVWLS